MKKMIAIDLDETTLNDASLLTPQTKKVLQMATAAGHQVVIATGRPYRMSDNFYHALQLKTPMINLNGAIVHIPDKNWVNEKHFMLQRDLALEIIEQKQTFAATFIAAENKETFYIDDLHNYDARWFASTATEDNLLTPQNLSDNPASIMLGTSPENVQPLAQLLRAKYGQLADVRTWGGPYSVLEMTAKGVHKASGLAYLAERLNLKRENIIAFGDEHNDVEMLSWAGWGVAMANGSAEAKLAANDQTTLSNVADGLAAYLLDYLKLG